MALKPCWGFCGGDDGMGTLQEARSGVDEVVPVAYEFFWRRATAATRTQLEKESTCAGHRGPLGEVANELGSVVGWTGLARAPARRCSRPAPLGVPLPRVPGTFSTVKPPRRYLAARPPVLVRRKVLHATSCSAAPSHFVSGSPSLDSLLHRRFVPLFSLPPTVRPKDEEDNGFSLPCLFRPSSLPPSHLPASGLVILFPYSSAALIFWVGFLLLPNEALTHSPPSVHSFHSDRLVPTIRRSSVVPPCTNINNSHSATRLVSSFAGLLIGFCLFCALPLNLDLLFACCFLRLCDETNNTPTAPDRPQP